MRPTLLLFVFCLLLAHAAVHAFDEDFWINTTESVQHDLRYVANMATAHNGDIYAATGSGLWHSQNNGNSWEHVPVSDFGIIAGVTILRDGSIMVGGRDSLHHSIDNGKTWTTYSHIVDNIPQIDYYRFVENQEGTLFVAMRDWYSGQFVADGIWQSSDRGESWKLVCDNFTNGAKSTCIGLHPNGDVFWGSWDREGIFVLRAETQTCRNVNTPFGGNLWDSYSMAVNSKGTILVGTNIKRKAVLRSSDAGESWEEFDGRNSEIPTGVILAMLVDSKDNFFCSAGGSIWYSDSDGTSWINVFENDPSFGFYSLSVDSLGYLYGGTNKGDIFRSRESIYTTTSLNNPDIENLATETLDLRLSPNPVAGRLNINFALESEDMVAVRLYDLRGLLLKKMTERRLAAGPQAMRLDVSDLGPGVYSLRLEAGGIVVNRLVAVHR